MTEEIQLSEAEKRLLRRVFHRHALPYIAVLGLIALFSLSSGSDDGAESEVVDAPVAATPPVDVEALRETQSRAEALLAELAQTREQAGVDLEAASRKIAVLEDRLKKTTSRLKKVEKLAREAMDKAATLHAAAEARASAPSGAENTASIQDKLRRLSPKDALADGATSPPAAPDSASN
jgi:hypothetical protein